MNKAARLSYSVCMAHTLFNVFFFFLYIEIYILFYFSSIIKYFFLIWSYKSGMGNFKLLESQFLENKI